MQLVQNEPALDLEAVEPVVGHSPLGLRVVWNREFPGAGERFQILAHRLHRASMKKGTRVLLTTSAIPAEGKSTVALNLAGVLALKGARTLVIDADLRVPRIRRAVTADPLPGLSSVLTGRTSLQSALRYVDPPGLYMLAAGDPVENPVPLLETPNFENVLKKAREAFDWVIIDSPPINPLADAQCIASLVDGILLVVRWGYTPKKELDHALTMLEGLPLLGLVMNCFDEANHSDYYSYYYRPEVLPPLLTSAGPASLPEPSTNNGQNGHTVRPHNGDLK